MEAVAFIQRGGFGHAVQVDALRAYLLQIADGVVEQGGADALSPEVGLDDQFADEAAIAVRGRHADAGRLFIEESDETALGVVGEKVLEEFGVGAQPAFGGGAIDGKGEIGGGHGVDGEGDGHDYRKKHER